MMVPSQSYYFSSIVTLCFFFLVSIFVRTLASPTQHSCHLDQRDALLEFKHELTVSSGYDKLSRSGKMSSDLYESSSEGGPCEVGWLRCAISFSSWNKSSDCCNWEGVTCDAESGQVIYLGLINSIPNGSLKTNTSLLKLQHLQILLLKNCSLYGDIPASLGNLSQLTYLDLSNNKLEGQVPASLGNLTQLEYLDLGYNNLSGNIPVSLANLGELSYLDIGGNKFTSGKFLYLLPNLTRLSYVSIHSNNLQSKFPPDLSGLHNLECFEASENSFSGPFPKSLLNNPLLSYMLLGGNQFKGPIEFGNTSSLSTSLEYMYLADNNFDGPIPKSISKLVTLRGLDLSNNKLEGQVPGFLRRMMTLRLSHNAFNGFGKLWEASDDISRIQELKVNSNSFHGPFPHWICNLRSLKLLELSHNLFNGSIPPCLINSFLEVLVLRNNSLSGILPDIFVNATSLSVLDVSRNQLEGQLPKSLINCSEMLLLNVEKNKIKDGFPSWLGSLPMLSVLLLRSNQFYGQLYHHHVSIGFQGLRVLDVSHNDFTGTLPPFYFSNWPEMTNTLGGQGQVDDFNDFYQYMDGSLNFNFYHTSMEIVNKGVDLEFERIHIDFKAIDFSENRLWGNIPESIRLLKGLHVLNLSGNAFTGSIPPSLENLTSLESLDLSRNRLSGQIPQGLVSLSSLSYMNFSHNNLEGPIPQGTQFQSQNCSSFMNNPRLYGLEEICVQTHVPVPLPQPSEEILELKEQMINWIVAVIAYGPGVLFGLVVGHITTSHT